MAGSRKPGQRPQGRTATPRCQTSRPSPTLRGKSNCTLDWMRSNPGAIVSPADLHAAGIIPESYNALSHWRARGWLPEPLPSPNGWIKFLAGAVLRHRGL